MSSSDGYPRPTIVCTSWCNGGREDNHAPESVLAERPPFQQQLYTDRDLAADLNALSFQERQALEEDIHGVAQHYSSQQDETNPAWVAMKLEEFKKALTEIPPSRKQAWERATFLRPGLSQDSKLHLQFLRAKHFDPLAAADLVVAYYENKRNVWCRQKNSQDDMILVRRITFQDLSSTEQGLVRSGLHRLLPGRESKGRGVAFSRVRQWDVNGTSSPTTTSTADTSANPQAALTRALWYLHTSIEDDISMQQKGVVSVSDLRGTFKSSPLELLQFLSTIAGMVENMPYHNASTHIIYDHTGLNNFIQSFPLLFTKEFRVRNRFHYGSTMEIDYSLRSFGLKVADALDLEDNTSASDLLSPIAMEDYIQQQQTIEQAVLQAEMSFLSPTSYVALYPNPQDILLGRNKTTNSWRGNKNYQRIIDQQALRYIEVQSKDRIEKTLVTLETIHILQKDYGARLLQKSKDARSWEVMSDADAQKKVNQALRLAAKTIISKRSPFSLKRKASPST